jgi:hypothetical protein
MLNAWFAITFHAARLGFEAHNAAVFASSTPRWPMYRPRRWLLRVVRDVHSRVESEMSRGVRHSKRRRRRARRNRPGSIRPKDGSPRHA